MQFSKIDLKNLKDHHLSFEDEITYHENDLNDYPRIRKVTLANVKGTGEYDAKEEKLYLNLLVNGMIIVPCDISFEDVELSIDINENLEFSFIDSRDPDVYYLKDGILDFKKITLMVINQDLPIKIVKEGLTEYPKGDGWEVLTEKQLQEQKKNQIDPRLEKLLEFNKQN